MSDVHLLTEILKTLSLLLQEAKKPKEVNQDSIEIVMYHANGKQRGKVKGYRWRPG